MKKSLRPISEDLFMGDDPDRSSPGEMHISKGHAVSLANCNQGYLVTCKSGLIWLTQENDTGDYFINGGESFAVSSSGRIVFEALHDSVVSIVPC